MNGDEVCQKMRQVLETYYHSTTIELEDVFKLLENSLDEWDENATKAEMDALQEQHETDILDARSVYYQPEE